MAANTTITIKRSPTDAPALPAALVSRGEALAFTPHGQTFTKPVTIQVPFTGTSSAGAALYTADPGGPWTEITSATVFGNTLKAEVTHFSFFTVAQTRPVTTVFSDDFNRADGALGSSYTVQVYPTTGTIAIAGNRAEIAGISTGNTYSKILYNTDVTATSIRVSALFNVTTPQKSDYELAARISASGSDTVAYGAGLYMSTNTLQIVKNTVDSAGMPKSAVTLASTPFTATTATVYNLVFTVDGGKLSLSISTGTGTPTTISATDASPLTTGKVSINGNNTASSKLTIDDLKIEKFD